MNTVNYIKEYVQMLFNIPLRSDFADKYWGYKVYDDKNELVFIWYDKLSDIVEMKSIKKCDQYNPSIIYNYYLVESYNNRLDAENGLNKLITGGTPRYNLRFRLYGAKYRILCIETGIVYNSSTEICSMFNVSPSALSKHLNRKVGYKSVKGFRFIYTDAPHSVKHIYNTYNDPDYLLPKLHHYTIEGEK